MSLRGHRRGITSRLTGAGSLLPPVYSEAWTKGRRPGQGRRRATTPNEDRYLVLTARRHRNMNATLLQQHLRSPIGTTVFNSDCPKPAPWCRSVCSPTADMNPIEHVWEALERRVAGRQPPPQTLQELERALLEDWGRIPQLVINSLIDSMPQRCSTLLAVRGNPTPY
ncbi:transposable element Tcb2 transposase [Trichonephila clavipes]|nr:transposable element Tcb2 transposase [Trichonephila clavipes]